MQELVGRLTSLDTEASESLKVIAYFDALVAGDVSIETLARGAALLSGAIAGVNVAGQQLRIKPDGHRTDSQSIVGDWLVAEPTPDAQVWIEREGPPLANDTMILERFSLAVSVLRARRRTVEENPALIVIDGTKSEQERLAAATRLRLENSTYQVVASPPEVSLPGPNTLVATSSGIVRATVIGSKDFAGLAPLGIGTSGPASHLAESWAEALLSLRLTDTENLQVDASKLGILLTAVQQLERQAEQTGIQHRDVRALLSYDSSRRRMLEALTTEVSVRSAATVLGLHHSTLQSHHNTFTEELGYDPRSPQGRSRHAIAALLVRLTTPIWTAQQR